MLAVLLSADRGVLLLGAGAAAARDAGKAHGRAAAPCPAAQPRRPAARCMTSFLPMLSHDSCTSWFPPFQHRVYLNVLRMPLSNTSQNNQVLDLSDWRSCICRWSGLEKHRPHFRGAQTTALKSSFKITFVPLKFEGQEHKKITSHVT